MVFKYAYRYFGITSDPTHVISPFKRKFDEIKSSSIKTDNVWTEQEFIDFISNVHIEKYKLFFIILYYTGIRLGEALALTWNDYNGASLNINKSCTKNTKQVGYEIKSTKTLSSIRNVTIDSNISSLLDDYHDSVKLIKGYSDDWFIFGNIKPLSRTNIDRVRVKAIKESGVKNLTLHGFRHSHASNLISNSINIVAVSKRLGHSSIDMTLRVYTHLMPKNDKELLEYLEKSSQNLPKTKIKP